MAAELSKLDRSFTREYNLANEIVEQLVLTETPLISFLRTDDYDPAKAAKRLAQYWKSRRELFGDRWLLPMTLTGRGAMSTQDVALFRTGFLLTYSFPNTDKGYGYVDNPRSYDILTQHPSMLSDNSIERCVFYQLTVATNESLQTKGLCVFGVVSSRKLPQLIYRPAVWKIIHEALPIKFSKLVVVQAHEEGKEHLLDFIRAKQNCFLSYNTRLCGQEIFGDSVRETRLKLDANGFDRAHVPVELGGYLNFDSIVDDFVRTRLAIEDMMAPNPTMVRPKRFAVGAPQELIVHRNSSRRSTKRPAVTNGEPDPAQAKRARQALYSRRNYHRNKLTHIALEKEVQYLQERNTSAKREQQRLECLLQQAMMLAGFVETMLSQNSMMA